VIGDLFNNIGERIFQMSEVEHAEKIVIELEEKRECPFSRTKLLSKQRQEVSYAAHTGDKTARARLNQINVEASTHSHEIESVEAALEEARARLNAAKGIEARAADKANALKLRTANAEFKELGDDADDALWDFVQAVNKILTKRNELEALGATAPTSEQVRVNVTNAIKAKIQELPSSWVRDFDFPLLAPNQKKDGQGNLCRLVRDDRATDCTAAR
jgi:hypothetical protein